MAAVDAKTRKAIHDDIDRTTIPQEMKLMYIVASACQTIVENVHRRVKSEFRKHGLIAGENELLQRSSRPCESSPLTGCLRIKILHDSKGKNNGKDEQIQGFDSRDK